MTARNPRLLSLILVALAAAVALGTLVALDLSGRSAPQPTPIRVGGSPLLGRPAPPLELAGLDGGIVSLESFRGRPVIVNFWASWCEPCKEEFPLFRRARDAHAEAGLEILGVLHDDSDEAARRFVAAQGAPWPILVDPTDAAYNAYLVPGLPTTYYVDRAGIVRAVSFGPPPSGVLDEQLRLIL